MAIVLELSPRSSVCFINKLWGLIPKEYIPDERCPDAMQNGYWAVTRC